MVFVSASSHHTSWANQDTISFKICDIAQECHTEFQSGVGLNWAFWLWPFAQDRTFWHHAHGTQHACVSRVTEPNKARLCYISFCCKWAGKVYFVVYSPGGLLPCAWDLPHRLRFHFFLAPVMWLWWPSGRTPVMGRFSSMSYFGIGLMPVIYQSIPRERSDSILWWQYSNTFS